MFLNTNAPGNGPQLLPTSSPRGNSSNRFRSNTEQFQDRRNRRKNQIPWIAIIPGILLLGIYIYN